MIKSIFIIIGTVIGAGFASGQEIYIFFNKYNENGLAGLFISNIITGIVIYAVLKKCNKSNICTYRDLLKSTKTSEIITNTLNIIINVFLLISFYIMVAGFTSYFYQEFKVSKTITSIIILIICYIMFSKKIDGIAKVNNIIIPVLILAITIIGIKINAVDEIIKINLEKINWSANWIIKSMEYASYNSILLIPMLINIKKFAKNREGIISIGSTLILFVLSLVIYCSMLKYDVGTIEIPMVYISSTIGNFFKYLYGIVIVFAIYTTMISAGYGFLQNCTKTEKSYKKILIFMCISALFISRFSFSGLVNLTYPVFGVLGALQLVKLFW